MLTEAYQRWVQLVLAMEPRTETEEILKENIRNIVAVALRYKYKEEADDLVSVGLVGFMEALKYYDPEKGDLGKCIFAHVNAHIYAYVYYTGNNVRAPEYIIRVSLHVNNVKRYIQVLQPTKANLAHKILFKGINKLDEFDLLPELKKKLRRPLTLIRNLQQRLGVNHHTMITRAIDYTNLYTNLFSEETDSKHISLDLEAFSDYLQVKKLYNGLTRAQRKAVSALYTTGSCIEAGKELGVTRQAIFYHNRDVINLIRDDYIED